MIPILSGRTGYEEFLFKPAPGDRFTFARAEYERLYGRIISEWKQEGDDTVFEITILINPRAEIVLQDGPEGIKGAGHINTGYAGRT